ncbi:MAG: EVE domain-containing protein [Verrucomicrobiia bacterium]
MNYWLVKSEPAAYAWTTFVQDGRTTWTGVRNYTARNNLRAMKTGDLVFFYHSGGEKSVVGVARVAAESYPDPTADEGGWLAVDLVPVKPVIRTVALAEIKSDRMLQEMKLVKQSRLSVSPVTREQFVRLLERAETRV